MEEDESKELDELWTSTYIFITLFLLSVSYSATVTLFKVGPRVAGLGKAGGTTRLMGQSHFCPLAGTVGLLSPDAGQARGLP